jgi:DNA-binding transcriptional MerR regulator
VIPAGDGACVAAAAGAATAVGEPGARAATPAPPRATLQIGEVAERIGLSQTTLRHYDQAGLVVPSARSQGGFRLYTEDDVARLLLVRRMKPLGFSVGEMRELLGTVEALCGEALSGEALSGEALSGEASSGEALSGGPGGPGGPDASSSTAAPDGQPQKTPEGSPPDATVLLERLAAFHAAATTRCALLEAELAMAQEYADMLGSLLGADAGARTR